MSRSFVTLAVVVLMVLASGSQSPAQSQERGTPSSSPRPDSAIPLKPDDQAPAQAGTEESQKESASAMPSLIVQLPDYGGDVATRSFLLGDWGGARTDLAERGILFDLSAEQFLQSNAHGGKDTNNSARYFGSWDLHLKLDTARMQLWPGGLLDLHAESQFGDSVNDEVGSAANDDALFPLPGNRDVMLSHVMFTQVLSEHFGVVLGKLDTTTGDENEFAWINGDNFLHTNFSWNPVNARTTPYSTLGAGAFVFGDWGRWSVTVYDTEGVPNESGFDTVFDGGTSVATEARFNVKPFDRPGHQLVGATWSDKNFLSLDQDPRVGIALPDNPFLRLALLDLSLERESGSWSFFYNFDQYLWVEPEDPKQGVGLFGRFGLSDGQANPIENFYSVGIGGRGIIPDRDNDKFGVGYYYLGYSGKLADRLNIRSAQGVEAFYEVEVTPWFHLTPDLQVLVNPGGQEDADVAIVCGLRGKVTF